MSAKFILVVVRKSEILYDANSNVRRNQFGFLRIYIKCSLIKHQIKQAKEKKKKKIKKKKRYVLTLTFVMFSGSTVIVRDVLRLGWANVSFVSY